MPDATFMSHPVSETISAAVTKVAVIEDHREYRDYLTAPLLNGSEGFHCVGSFSFDGRGAA